MRNDQEDTGIYLLTIHSSKGLEFDVVFIVAVDLQYFYMEKLKKLFFVACTRAKEKLFVSSHKHNHNKAATSAENFNNVRKKYHAQ